MPVDTFPQFQEFLIKEKGIPEKNAPYHSLWVDKFLSFREKAIEEEFDSALKRFLSHLYSQNTEEWQARQAEQAVRFYFQEFRQFSCQLFFLWFFSCDNLDNGYLLYSRGSAPIQNRSRLSLHLHRFCIHGTRHKTAIVDTAY